MLLAKDVNEISFSFNEIVSLSSGVLASNKRIECPNEQFELECPGLESAVQTGTYLELQWSVTDSEYLKKQYVGYCNKNFLCASYRNIGSFDSRINVSSPVRGKLLVKHKKLNDQLIYKCIIERNGNKGPIANKIIVTSSKRWK